MHKLNLPATLALALAAALAAALLTAAIAGWSLVGYLLLLAVACAAAGYALFLEGALLAPTELGLPLLLSLFLAVTFQYLSAARGREAFRRAVRIFVGRKVADALDETGAFNLTGRRENVTILFTDIRGFTAWCDQLEPEVVVARLNHYFAGMTACIVRHGGDVNKFIGDGILAIFHGPSPAARRCHRWRQPGEFRTGAGIHTGDALVGNMGSGDKMEYTALGDTVNLPRRGPQQGVEDADHDERGHGLRSGRGAARRSEVAVRGISAQQALYTVVED